MAVSSTQNPEVIKLERMDRIVPVKGAHNMISAAIWDADPSVTPDAHSTMLAAMFPDHHAQIVGQEEQPLLGRPVYFVRRRGTNNLELWPRCDQTYWFRATFRAPIKYGVQPSPEVG